MQVKTCPAMIKAAGTHEGTDEGVFEAIVATYDVDSVGDRIVPGAFAKTLAEWRESGDPIPVVWSHKSDDPNYHVGYVLEAEERPEGLWVKAKIDTDAPTAAQVYRLLKGRRIRQFSFAYDEVDARPSEKAATGADKDLHELKVYEVGPTMIGANQRTSLLGVKSVRPVLRKGHGMTARDLRTALDSKLTAAHGGSNRYVWVRDYTDEWVAFEVNVESGLNVGANTTYQQTYTVTDGAVELTGTPVEVVERTEYVPAKDAAETAEKIADAATGLKAGRALSKRNEERVAQIAQLASELLAAVRAEGQEGATGESGAPSNAEKAAPTAPAVPEESPAAEQAAPDAEVTQPAESGVADERLRAEIEFLDLELHAL